jgi:hypothetical protein
MQPHAFETFLADHDQVRAGLARAARAAPAKDYSTGLELAALVLFLPLVQFLLLDIGLPWLVTLKRYSEVQRRRVEAWIDAQAIGQGLDPDAVEAASRALMQELEQTHDASARAQWERLAELLKQSD